MVKWNVRLQGSVTIVTIRDTEFFSGSVLVLEPVIYRFSSSVRMYIKSYILLTFFLLVDGLQVNNILMPVRLLSSSEKERFVSNQTH